MNSKNISWILRIIISALFLLSAVAKLYPSPYFAISTFEVKQLYPLGFSEGYHLYDYRDELKIGETKYLYMKASFKNAKTGRATNLMVKNTAFPVDTLVHELYTRYILTRDTTGYYYKFDETYQGNVGTIGTNNVNHVGNDVIINLYQIQAT